MALSSRVLRRLSENIEDFTFIAEVEEDVRLFNDENFIETHYWSNEKNQFSDYGNHSASVRLIPIKDNDRIIYIREVLKEPKLRFVDDVFGYVNLFPFLLKLLPPNSEKLGIILKNLNNTEDLWSKYGLRSISPRSPYYNVRNTEHDPPYWKGYVWINMNYLALDSLYFYGRTDGPYSELCNELYASLKSNIISNIAKQYRQTGFFWENYNDITGQGQGKRENQIL